MFDSDPPEMPIDRVAEFSEQSHQELVEIRQLLEKIQGSMYWIAGCVILLTALAFKVYW